MKQIKLEILAEDILLDNYYDSDHCPITKALHRAGFPDLEDQGCIYVEGTCINSYNNESYKDLLIKLLGMYNSFSKHGNMFLPSERGIPPTTVGSFTHTIEY